MKSSKLKIKIKKRLYRNIGYTLLLLFSFYICYKTYQTQRIKQIRKFREGFKEGMNAQEAKANLENAINDAVNDCTDECLIDENSCPPKSDCKDLKGSAKSECIKESNDCNKGTKDCKKACAAPKPAK
jgi:hypothetical protein